MPICVAGMGRSGTSMIAHLLHLTGVYLGRESDLMGADSGNRDGYWENLHFVAINDEVLHIAGGAWDCPPHVCEGWETGEAFADARANARSLIDQFPRRRLWGWKDPRNSLTAPFWLHLIPDLTFVICVRNPLEVAFSLRHRWGFSLALGLDLWRQYNRRVLDDVSPAQRIVTHYGAYFAHPETAWGHVLGALHLDASPAAQERVRAAITPGFRGTHFAMRDLIDGGAPQAVIDLYRRLCTEAQWDDSVPPIAATADTVRDWNRIWHTAPLPVTPERQHLDAVERERATLQRHLENVEHDRDDLRRHLEQTNAHLTDVERDRDDLRAYVDDLAAQRQAIEQDRDDLRQHLGQTNAHLAGVERDRDDLRAYVADILAQQHAVEGDRNDLRRHLEQTNAHLTDVERDRDALRAYVDDLAAQRQAIDQDRAALRDYLGQIADHARDLERDRDDLRQHLTDIERDRDDLRAYVTHILAHLQTVEEDREALRAYLTTVLDHLADIERDRDGLRAYVADLLAQLEALKGDHASLHTMLAMSAASRQEITRDRDDQRARAGYWQREHEFLSAVIAERARAIEALQTMVADREGQIRDQAQLLAARHAEIDVLTADLAAQETRVPPRSSRNPRAALRSALGTLRRRRDADPHAP